MKIEDKITDKPATEENIASLEATLGFTLPEDYRLFLMQHNGGSPALETSSFVFVENGAPSEDNVDFFYGLDEASVYDLLKKIDVLEDRIPPGFLAIADDPGGNKILLGLTPEERGHIYFWDHEREDEEDLRANISFISSSFTEFTESLHEVPEV